MGIHGGRMEIDVGGTGVGSRCQNRTAIIVFSSSTHPDPWRIPWAFFLTSWTSFVFVQLLLSLSFGGALYFQWPSSCCATSHPKKCTADSLLGSVRRRIIYEK